MAVSLNKVTLIGNVGKDPEIRNMQYGREVASFSIATSESWKDKTSGERKERTEWHRVVVFSQPLVTIIKNNVNKGSRLFLEGSLQTRKWTDQSGADKYTTEVVLQPYGGTMMMLDGRGAGASAAHNDDRPTAAAGGGKESQALEATNYEAGDIDDEIPF